MTNSTPARPVIFGEVLFDCFPDGQAVLGGAPFNVAWHLQALGLEPLFVSRIGRDELGERILAAMSAWGMTVAGVQHDPHRPTGTVEVTIRDGEPAYSIAPDRAYDAIDPGELKAPCQGGILYHGTLVLRSEPSRQALAALRRSTQGPLLVDVNLREPWWDREGTLGLLQDATWVKLNEGELSLLVPEREDTAARAQLLRERAGLAALIVTRGADGSLVYEKDDMAGVEAPVPAAPVVDTVGAGDAFSSVVILGLSRGWSWPLIQERAQAFAAAVVGLRGATTDDLEFYQPFTASWGHA